MQLRQLGKIGPQVSAIGFGCMGLTGSYGSAPEGLALSAIEEACKVGITLFNTADFYGAGENQKLLGRALRGRRERAIISTKIGIRLDENNRPSIVDGRPEYLKSACDASLERLGTSVIDLLILCRLDPDVPIEDSVGALSELVAAGKARYIGLSEVSTVTIRRAHSVHPISAIETEYSIWERHVEKAVLPVLRELSIGLLAYSPLGRGFLTGTIDAADELEARDIRRHMPRFEGSSFVSNQQLVRSLTQFASEKHATSAQVALAWLLSKGSEIVPIPGTRKSDRVRENVSAADIELTPIEIERLDSLFPFGVVAGERYPEAFMKSIDQD